ncbi:PIG-L family deacetylase [Corynebacterium sp. CNCTC7651]|uniref:PIG-L deacetylase family protein n=1 Tax=Corynebacterium sp. CNCTC7651 TaxID=2815361 RepID=UPI001F3D52DF|nr:PIG-L deacetylase family protein [Corynebacterium sp. CNCTC7651]UIZ92096.1 PIG-L family deacetylase [Corynebacterium sp. CNCTC7651]
MAVERLELEAGDSVLAVVAHPDDMEYGASAAVAKWTEAGIPVDYLLITRGEHGIAGMDPGETARIRTAEQRHACDIVDARDLEFLDLPGQADGTLTSSLELREAIATVIRSRRPSVIVTQSWDIVAPWGLNQADHRVAGLAALDAARDAGNEFVFPEAGERHQARLLLVSGHAEPDVAVALEPHHVEKGAASLDAHEAYFSALPDHPAGSELVGGMAEQGASLLDDGTGHAILFKAYPL